MKHRIVFLPGNVETAVPHGTLVSDAAKQAGVWIDSPCGGNGTCKKCAVLLTCSGRTERVLACQTRIEADCSVSPLQTEILRPLEEGSARTVPLAPYPAADYSRELACMAAFDLGTTTIVCYLLDAKSGEQIAVGGMQNPQSAYGADVIARANYALTGGQPKALQACIIEALNSLLLQTLGTCNREPGDVSLITLVGNTVMHHLLLGYPLEQRVRSPYAPYRVERQVLPAAQLGLCADCALLLAPLVGGFVGADTIACLSATAFDAKTEPTLLIDIGTNGEMALTNGTRMVCCSTAAGPAFEGANISCGMRAVSGAIDRVWLEQNRLRYSVIGGGEPFGLCGSGLIDLCALLSNLNVIDESGRFNPEENISGESGRFDEDAPLGNRIFTLENGMKAFLISDSGQRLALTQKDVRELQLGKAAIRAGIEVLLQTLSLSAEQVRETLLAGAFGNHLSPQSLCDIGLLPRALLHGVRSIGNAAGEGAKLYAKNFELFEASEALARNTDFIELALSHSFTDYYVDAMAFPREELREEL